MKPLNPRFIKGPLYKERAYLAGSFLAIGIIFYILVYTPLAKKVAAAGTEANKLNGELAQYQSVVSAIEKDARRFEEIMATYRAMEEGLLFVKERLPTVKEISGILKEVSGHHPGISLVSIRPLSIEDKGMYLRFPLSMQMRGDFPSFGRYLSGLDSSKRLISIENIDIARNARQEVSVKMELSVYLLKEGAL